MMLMIFGYYYAIINTIKTFLDNLRAFDLAGMKEDPAPGAVRDRRGFGNLSDRKADHVPL